MSGDYFLSAASFAHNLGPGRLSGSGASRSRGTILRVREGGETLISTNRGARLPGAAQRKAAARPLNESDADASEFLASRAGHGGRGAGLTAWKFPSTWHGEKRIWGGLWSPPITPPYPPAQSPRRSGAGGRQEPRAPEHLQARDGDTLV